MAGRSTYTDEEKAAVIAVWRSNGENLARTARETGVSRNTIRHWLSDAPPPSEMVEEQVSAFVSRATTIRDTALEKLADQIKDGELKGRDLITVIGVLDDKVVRASGAPTSRTEHVNALPPREQLAEILGAFVDAAVEKADERDADIRAAEYTGKPPLRALPGAREQA